MNKCRRNGCNSRTINVIYHIATEVAKAKANNNYLNMSNQSKSFFMALSAMLELRGILYNELSNVLTLEFGI